MCVQYIYIRIRQNVFSRLLRDFAITNNAHVLVMMKMIHPSRCLRDYDRCHEREVDVKSAVIMD